MRQGMWQSHMTAAVVALPHRLACCQISRHPPLNTQLSNLVQLHDSQWQAHARTVGHLVQRQCALSCPLQPWRCLQGPAPEILCPSCCLDPERGRGGAADTLASSVWNARLTATVSCLVSCKTSLPSDQRSRKRTQGCLLQGVCIDAGYTPCSDEHSRRTSQQHCKLITLKSFSPSEK